MTNWATYPLEVMARDHVLNDEEVRMMCAHIAALEAELTAARRCPLCGGRTQEIATKVKPLVWEAFGTMAFIAEAPLFGRLRVEQFGRGNTWTVCFSVPGYSDTFLEGEWPDPDAAKAAAQADYERRILSALECAPVQSAQARPSVAEAAKALEAHIEADPTAATRALAAIPAKASDLVSHWFVYCLRALIEEPGK